MPEQTTLRDLLTAAYKEGMVLRRCRRTRSKEYRHYELTGPRFERVSAQRHTDQSTWWVTFSATTVGINYVELDNPTIEKLLMAINLCGPNGSRQ